MALAWGDLNADGGRMCRTLAPNIGARSRAAANSPLIAGHDTKGIGLRTGLISSHLD